MRSAGAEGRNGISGPDWGFQRMMAHCGHDLGLDALGHRPDSGVLWAGQPLQPVSETLRPHPPRHRFHRHPGSLMATAYCASSVIVRAELACTDGSNPDQCAGVLIYQSLQAFEQHSVGLLLLLVRLLSLWSNLDL